MLWMAKLEIHYTCIAKLKLEVKNHLKGKPFNFLYMYKIVSKKAGSMLGLYIYNLNLPPKNIPVAVDMRHWL